MTVSPFTREDNSESYTGGQFRKLFGNSSKEEVAGRMPTKKPRYTVIVDEEMLKRIDDFRFERRYQSRSAATLELIRIGMDALEKQKSDS